MTSVIRDNYGNICMACPGRKTGICNKTDSSCTCKKTGLAKTVTLVKTESTALIAWGLVAQDVLKCAIKKMDTVNVKLVTMAPAVGSCAVRLVLAMFVTKPREDVLPQSATVVTMALSVTSRAALTVRRVFAKKLPGIARHVRKGVMD